MMMENSHQGKKSVPFFEISGNMQTGIVLIADHARNTLPPEYGSLGLPAAELERHIAYDIGAEALTRALAKQLDAPAILSNFSRLLIDPNRGETDPTLIMQLSDGALVPGNYPLDDSERQRRIDCFYKPYDRAIDQLIAQVEHQSGQSPLVISIHSFTPVWRGIPRPWQIGLLWDSDPRVFNLLYHALQQSGDLTIGDNQPYDGALKGDTMYRHCTQKGIAHILIEIRQDLICDADGVETWAQRLAPIVRKINLDTVIHMKQFHVSRCD